MSATRTCECGGVVIYSSRGDGDHCLRCQREPRFVREDPVRVGDLVMTREYRYGLVIDAGERLVHLGDGRRVRLSESEWSYLVVAPAIAGEGGKTNFLEAMRDFDGESFEIGASSPEPSEASGRGG